MYWLINLLKRMARSYRVIPDRIDPSKPYLTRWYLIGGEDHKFFSLVLHEFHCSDPTDEHDHPFSFLSLILSGGYYEIMDGKAFWRKPLSLLFRSWKEKHKHRIVLGKAPVYTLVALLPRIGLERFKAVDWGFYTKAGWVHHDRYFEDMKRAKALRDLTAQAEELDLYTFGTD